VVGTARRSADPPQPERLLRGRARLHTQVEGRREQLTLWGGTGRSRALADHSADIGAPQQTAGVHQASSLLQVRPRFTNACIPAHRRHTGLRKHSNQLNNLA